MRNRIRRLIPLIACTLLIALPAGTFAKKNPGVTASPQPLQLSSSQLHVDGVRVSPGFEFLNGDALSIWNECVAFTNDSTSIATQVLFDFSWISLNGKDVVDEFYPFSGTFPRSIPEGAILKEETGICRPTMHEFAAGGLRVFVSNIYYKDGTSWHLVPPVIGTLTNELGSPVALSNVATYSFSSPVRSNERRDFPQPVACADITNMSQKTTSGVQLAFRHLASDGTTLGTDALTIQAQIPPGRSVKNNCREFSGTVSPGIRYYALMASMRVVVQPPSILYNHQTSTLSATVTTIYFSDGTSWHA